jgi:uncharacterized protein (TIGR02757 family)
MTGFFMKKAELKEFLEYKVSQYNTLRFIDSDPISVPHLFQRKEDIEIAGFMTALLSWGNRKAIQKAGILLIELMDNDPFQFVMNSGHRELMAFQHFYYRTFQQEDSVFYIRALSNIYSVHGGLEPLFEKGYMLNQSVFQAIEHVRDQFFSVEHKPRQKKHFSSPAAGSACKRLNMFLRWMCRKDSTGVDFGIWKTISPSYLMCPLDVHSGRVARKLGLLSRKQNDRKAVEELTQNLRKLDPADPVKYDFALFGLGVFEKF